MVSEFISPHSTPIVALRCTYCGAALEAKESPPWTCEYCNTVFVGGPDSSPSYLGKWGKGDSYPSYYGRSGFSGSPVVDFTPKLVNLLRTSQLPMSELHEVLERDFDAAKEFLACPSGYGDTEQEVERKKELLDVIKKGLEKKEKRHLFWPF